jgi:hypothetical protein
VPLVGRLAIEVLEVVFAVSMKTMSNVYHMAETPLDKQFVPQVWGQQFQSV